MKKERDQLGEFISFVKKQFERTDQRFERQEKMLLTLTVDIRDIKEGQMLLDRRLDDFEVILRGLQRAVDKDAVKIISQERRIARLERTK